MPEMCRNDSKKCNRHGRKHCLKRQLTFSTENTEIRKDFHSNTLCHTYTSNMLSNGAAPKDVQELLGHSDVSTTMNVHAHATKEAKRTSARLLDKVADNE